MKNKSAHSTLTDVAREAGVGTTTVSRVINGGERVSPKTLARVQAVIQELGYQPNHAARILKGERAKTIGLIVPSIADSFFSSCAEVAQAISRSHDSLLIVASSSNDPRVEMESLNTLIQHRVDGLLLAPASRSEVLARTLSRISIPVVSFDRPIYNSNIPGVVSDNFNGAKHAVSHLIQHGYKRILCIGLEGEAELYTIQERIQGYRQTMLEAGLTLQVDTTIRDYQTAQSVLASYMAEPTPPDAIFCLKNIVTIYSCEAFQTLRVRVPQQVAILGFDDFELAATLQPSISVVRQPIEEIGKIAANLLFDQLPLKGKDKVIAGSPAPSNLIKLATSLVLRRSCGCQNSESA